MISRLEIFQLQKELMQQHSYPVRKIVLFISALLGTRRIFIVTIFSCDDLETDCSILKLLKQITLSSYNTYSFIKRFLILIQYI